MSIQLASVLFIRQFI